MNHTVSIPPDFFLREARQEYSDIRTRLVQELLQNSLDAGSTVIKMIFNDAGYSCEDNGRGMSQERMVSALLTMGGSVKEQGATGGFGAAKKLLLFAHSTFSIHSNCTFVEGAGLNYGFHVKAPRVGTMVCASFSNREDFARLEQIAISLLQKCNFRDRAKIYVNGVLFTNYASAKHAKSISGFGEVYANKMQVDGQNDVLVLHNGLFMFSRYISDLNRKVIVEVTGKSVDIFTQNREGFRIPYRDTFDSLMAEIAIDKKSIVKPRPRQFVLKGVDAFITHIGSKFRITPAVQAAINQIRMTAQSTSSLAEAVVNMVSNNALSTEQDRSVATEILTYVRGYGDDVQTDFHFDLADSSYRQVPAKFLPRVGRPKYTTLAQTWKVAIRSVLEANGIDQKFVIGFTFSSEAVATHQMKDGTHRYLINPLSDEIDSGTKEEKVMKILTTAVHEVVHSTGIKWHDENFVRKFHDLLVPTLTHGLTWRQIVKTAKQETI